MSVQAKTRRFSLKDVSKLYQAGEKISVLTAYDAITARLVELAGCELILVGDSLGNVVLGYDTTVPVRLEDTLRHTAAVVRGTERALVIADLPFGTYRTPEIALESSIRLFQETQCGAVKLEGGIEVAPIIECLTTAGIPVMAHIGLTPQSVHQMGGYRMHGKTSSEAERLLADARAVEKAGAFSVVIECVVEGLAAEITQSIGIPTIGIGASPACSGQVLVINDLIGLSLGNVPKFAKPRADVGSEILRAVREYVADVKSQSSPVTDSIKAEPSQENPSRSPEVSL